MENLTILPNSTGRDVSCERDYFEMCTFLLVTAISLFSNALFSLALRKLHAPKENKFHLVVKMFTLSNTMIMVPLLPLSLTSYIRCGWVGGYTSCAISGFLSAIFFGWSVSLLLLLCFYRYLAIVKPFYYRTRLSSKRTVIITTVALTWSACHSALPLVGAGRFRIHSRGWYCSINLELHEARNTVIVYLIIIEGILFTIVFLYFCMALRKVVKEERRVFRQLSLQQFRGANVLVIGKRRDQFAQMTLLIATVYWACSFPYLGYRACVVFSDGLYHNETVYFYTQMIAYLNPFLNIVVFLVMNKQYRHVMKEWLGRNRVVGTNINSPEEKSQFTISHTELASRSAPTEMYHERIPA